MFNLGCDKGSLEQIHAIRLILRFRRGSPRDAFGRRCRDVHQLQEGTWRTQAVATFSPVMSSRRGGRWQCGVTHVHCDANQEPDGIVNGSSIWLPRAKGSESQSVLLGGNSDRACCRDRSCPDPFPSFVPASSKVAGRPESQAGRSAFAVGLLLHPQQLHPPDREPHGRRRVIWKSIGAPSMRRGTR